VKAVSSKNVGPIRRARARAKWTELDAEEAGKKKPFLPYLCTAAALKGTVSRDFLLLVLFMNQFPPSIRVFH
jgi:hypothetical protein